MAIEHPFVPFTQYSSAWVLIIANLFPIIGVVFWGYDILHIFLLYWSESAIIGFFSILKIVFMKPENTQLTRFMHKDTAQTVFTIGKIVLIPFFLIHFSMFMLVHLMFIIIIFGQELWGSSFFIPFAAVFNIGSYFKIILPGFFLLFISHGYSFYVNFIKKYEYEKIDGKALMFQPYQRIGVMHFTIIFGAFLYMLSGELLTVLILLIVLKIGVDLRAHVKERKRMAFQQGFAKLFDF